MTRLLVSILLTATVLTGRLPVLAAADRDPSHDFPGADGLEVTLWAESPSLYNPTSIDVDARGRVWVAEAVNYRTFRQPDPNQPEAVDFRRPEGDRIVILEDTNGDGVCDSSKVFVQDPDLHAPLGVAVIGNRVLVSCSPHLIIYTDEDGDDRPDRKEILLTGFGGYDHDHGLHSLVGGPDGRWYFNVGNAGPHVVTDRGGWTLRSGSIYNGGTPHNTNNTPGLTSDDGRIHVGGLALRVDPDGTGLTVLAHNFRNSYEVAVDSFGDLWQSDNDDEVQACRTSWVMEGGNMGFFSADGTRSWRADRRPGQSIQTAHWHQEDPGVLPAGDIYGAGGPTGVAVYEGQLLPARFRGMILNADAGRNTVFGHIAHPDGAGFRLERTLFLSSRHESTEDYVWNQVSMDDRSTWFRPSDVAVGTDGAVYVADWYDPVVGGHAMREGSGYGRILRVAPRGSRPRSPQLDFSTTSGRIEALKNPAINVRHFAFQQLREEGGSALPELSKLHQSADAIHRARALWLLSLLEGEGRRITLEALNDSNTAIRVTAARALRASGVTALDWIPLLEEPVPPALWPEIAVQLRDVPLENRGQPPGETPAAVRTRNEEGVSRAEVLLAMAGQYDGQDRFFLEAFGIGCDGSEAALYPRLLAALGDPDPLKWPAPFADLVWRLHPAAAIPDLLKRARAEELSPEARGQAMDTLAFIPHREAADAMGALATTGPEDIQSHAQWWTQFRSGNDWRDYKVAARPEHPRPTTGNEVERDRMASLQAQLLASGSSAGERSAAAEALAKSREGGLRLVQLASQDRLSKEVMETIAEHIFRNPDLGVRALASHHFERPSRTGEAFPPIDDLVEMEGHPGRGRRVYFGATAACAQCHRFGEAGREVGPDLTAIRTKYDKAALLDAIMNPSAAIAFDYEGWIFTLKNGETLSGFVIADGDTVVIRDITGEQRSMAREEISSRDKLEYSLMPDNLTLGMTPQELVDLAAYLLRGP
ncbi:MAG TPA: PVC-type heme-binding CxxCH protein [Methylomirabilota bacterium]|nr:PVC-type heme-binding CxxCH protein [Methylomirabilota bacterium]